MSDSEPLILNAGGRGITKWEFKKMSAQHISLVLGGKNGFAKCVPFVKLLISSYHFKYWAIQQKNYSWVLQIKTSKIHQFPNMKVSSEKCIRSRPFLTVNRLLSSMFTGRFRLSRLSDVEINMTLLSTCQLSISYISSANYLIRCDDDPEAHARLDGYCNLWLKAGGKVTKKTQKTLFLAGIRKEVYAIWKIFSRHISILTECKAHLQVSMPSPSVY